MAEGSDNEKTEEPTQRKLEDAHEKGDTFKSQEVSTWFAMAAATLVVGVLATSSARSLTGTLAGLFEHAGDIRLDQGRSVALWVEIGRAVALACGLPILLLLVAGIAGHVIQHRPVFSTEPLKPKFSKISPMAGAKRLFSAEAVVNFVKGIAKIGVIGVAMFVVLWPQRDRLDEMVTGDPATVLGLTRGLSLRMLGTVLAILAVIAGLDYLWQRQRWMKRQRMSIEEIKEEHKQQEGDPHVKAKVRQLRFERSRKRMMAEVPKATVVVTNPTHFAVALRYEPGMQAPVCVAKGVDVTALRIRRIAEESAVPIVENPPLARLLYAAVELDAMIPAEHYRVVAEVIGYVMNLKRRGGWRAR